MTAAAVEVPQTSVDAQKVDTQKVDAKKVDSKTVEEVKKVDVVKVESKTNVDVENVEPKEAEDKPESDKFRRVQRPKEERNEEAFAREVRITASGGVSMFVKEAVRKLVEIEKGTPEVKLMARGPAIAKAVIAGEMIFRMIPTLEQEVELGSSDVQDEYVSVEGGEKIVATRIVPFLVITMRNTSGPIDKESVAKAPKNPRRLPMASQAEIDAAEARKNGKEIAEPVKSESKSSRRRQPRNRGKGAKEDAADPAPAAVESADPVTEEKAKKPRRARKDRKPKKEQESEEPSAFDGAVKPLVAKDDA